MAQVQKTYTREFKREAVRLAQTSGKSIAQVARELGISNSSIRQWRKELAEHGTEAFPGSGHQTALEEENRRLKRELERTRQERDMLKNSQYLLARPNFHIFGTTSLRFSMGFDIVFLVLGTALSALGLGSVGIGALASHVQKHARRLIVRAGRQRDHHAV